MASTNCPSCRAFLSGINPAVAVCCNHCGHTFLLKPRTPQQPAYGAPQYGTPQYGAPLYGPPASPLGAQYGIPPGMARPAGKRNTTLVAILAIGGAAVLLFVVVAGGVAIWFLRGSTSASPMESATEVQTSSTAPVERGGAPNIVSRTGSSNPFAATIAFDRQPAYSPSAAELHYTWTAGDQFHYKFTYEADILSQTTILDGSLTYVGTNTDPASVGPKDEASAGKASGTGFVVRPDGYLVTCAHVVEGSVKTEVVLQGSTYEGKVVALDTKHDLAVIRVRADNLPYLSITDSRDVRLAEEVRAFGFPMSDVLGESIKITRGSVSGIIEKRGNKLFQLDVSVNPGNSGGPVVNDKGQVVGVASLLMAGSDISAMSFAVPSGDVRKLLEKNGWNYAPANPADAVISGPDMAENVQRCVAFLKVTLGKGGVGDAEKRVVQFSSTWQPYTSPQGMNMRSNAGASVTDRGVVLVGTSGEVAYCDGTQSLPAHMGPVALMGLLQLPQDDSTTWETYNLRLVPETKTVQVLADPDPYDPLSRYRPYGRYRSQVQTLSSVKMHPAIESVRYQIVGTSGSVVTISRSYELTTLHADDEKPYTQVTGTGTLQFDKRVGMPVSYQYNGTLAVSIDGDSASLPFRLNYTLDGTSQQSVVAAYKPSTSTPPAPSTSSTTPPTTAPPTVAPPTTVAPPVSVPRPRPSYTTGDSSAPVSEEGLTKLDLSPPG